MSAATTGTTRAMVCALRLSGTGLQDWLLSGAERDDAADGIVGRDADGDAITRHDLDPEPAHPAAQLRENLMPRVALDAVQAA